MANRSDISACLNESNVLNVDLETAMSWLLTKTELIVYAFIIPCVHVLGLIGNASFLFVIARVPRMQNITNFFLGNLAVSDLMTIAFVMTHNIIHFAMNSLKQGNIYSTVYGCLISSLILNACYIASIGFITIATFERFLAVCFPLKHLVINTGKRAVRFVITCWIIAFTLASFVAPGHSLLKRMCVIWPEELADRKLHHIINECEALYSVFELASDMTQVITFLLGMIVNFIMYAGIIITLSRRSHSSLAKDVSNPTGSDTATIIRNKVAIMLVINGIVFYACISPFIYFNITDISGELFGVGELKRLTKNNIVLIARGMLAVNSSINPFIYSTTNDRYRRAFREAFLGRKSARYANSFEIDKTILKQ